MKASTIAQISLGTAVAGALGYAVYFDHKRRHDPEFRRKLKKESKRNRLETDRQIKSEQRARKGQMQEAIDDLRRPGVVPEDSAGKQQFFMENLSTGEAYTQLGPSHYTSAAISLFRAVKVYPNPIELISTVEQAVPKAVMEILIELMGMDMATERSRGTGQGDASSGAGPRGQQEADPNAVLAALLQQAGAQASGQAPPTGAAASSLNSSADDVDEDGPALGSNSQNSQDWVDVSDGGRVNGAQTAESSTNNSSNLAESASTVDSATTATPSASGVSEETQDIGETPEQSSDAAPPPSIQTDAASTPAAFDFSSTGASSFQPSPVFSPSSENQPPQ